MITNSKIERKRAEVARAETKLANMRTKLRVLKDELTQLENEEIVAQFRSEVITEDGFAALLHSRRSKMAKPPDDGDTTNQREEVLPDAHFEI